MERKYIIGGNWKMNKTISESQQYLDEFLLKVEDFQNKVDIVIAPPFMSLPTAVEKVQGSNVHIGAQDVFYEDKGAFTGEISAKMLKSAGVEYVIIGHSERRKHFNETNEIVSKKLKQAHKYGLKPILCVGETLDQREAGNMKNVIKNQVKNSLNNITKEELLRTVIAYEPVWAIGTGKTATPEQAQEAHKFIRNLIADMYDDDISQLIRIQYGGSIKPKNAKNLFSQPDIDGGLVGGASLDPGSFYEIIRLSLD